MVSFGCPQPCPRNLSDPAPPHLTSSLEPLTPVFATHPRNRLLSPFFATLPKIPSRKSFLCHTCDPLPRSFPILRILFQVHCDASPLPLSPASGAAACGDSFLLSRSLNLPTFQHSNLPAILCFQSLTNCKICKSFVLITIQNAGGGKGKWGFLNIQTFQPSNVATGSVGFVPLRPPPRGATMG